MKKYLIIGGLILFVVIVLKLVLFQAEVDLNKLDNLNGDIRVIGHGGSGFSRLIPFNPLPINSMASISKLLDEGCDGIEIDLQMSLDSVLILYHDERLDSKTDAEGCIPGRYADEVIGLPYKLGFPYDFFHNERIAGFDALLQKLASLPEYPHLYIDIHSFDYCKRNYDKAGIYARTLVRILRKNKLPLDKVHLTSTAWFVLDSIRKVGPEFILLYEITGYLEQELKKATNYDGLVFSEAMFNKELASWAHERKMPVITFGGHTSSGLARLIEKNPDVMQVDNVRALKNLLER